MTKKVNEVIDLLIENGWQYRGTKGDHHIFTKKGKRTIVVNGKRSHDLPIGTLKSILRTAGLTI